MHAQNANNKNNINNLKQTYLIGARETGIYVSNTFMGTGRRDAAEGHFVCTCIYEGNPHGLTSKGFKCASMHLKENI